MGHPDLYGGHFSMCVCVRGPHIEIYVLGRGVELECELLCLGRVQQHEVLQVPCVAICS